MPEIIIPIGFEAGINTNKSPILLEANELQSCKGFKYESSGKLVCRNTRTTVNETAVGSIHTLNRYMNILLCGDGANARYKWDLDGYCDQYIPPDTNFTLISTVESTKRWSVATYAKWFFFVNGRDTKAMSKGNLYEWGIPNPITPPSGAAGASGNPDGTYTLYYTYYVKFPNGTIYETGPSPSGSVTVSEEIITWGGIAPSDYAGTGVTIWRRLYRTVSGVAYRVTTIKDNTTTTYSDNVADTTLDDYTSIPSASYYQPPLGMHQIEYYLQRIWGIAGNTLYPSVAYYPMVFDPSASIAVTKEGEDLTAIKHWGDQLYLASKVKWYRLQGQDPTTWGIKRTFTDAGVINGHTVKTTKYGIPGQWYDGIYVFDGSVSRNVTDKQIGRSLFLNDISDVDACYAEWDGKNYYFYYPTSGTTISHCLIIDFTHYPTLRFHNDDFLATAHHYHVPTGFRYMGKSTGYQYEEADGAETIATELQSGGGHGKTIFQRKNLRYLWYDINTNSQDVTVAFYIDGSAHAHTKTLNNSSRTRARIGDFPQDMEGYFFDIKLSCAASDGIEIYEPWALVAETAGK